MQQVSLFPAGHLQIRGEELSDLSVFPKSPGTRVADGFRCSDSTCVLFLTTYIIRSLSFEPGFKLVFLYSSKVKTNNRGV